MRKMRVCSLSKTAAGMRCARSSDFVRSSSVLARPASGTAERPCRSRQCTQTLDFVAGLKAGFSEARARTLRA
jgi:hypothetical protein